MPTIREDVVSISFDVENNPFADITAGVNDMKKAVTGGVDSSTKKLNGLTQGFNKFKQTIKGSAKGSGLDDLKSDIEAGEAAIGIAKKKFDSFKKTVKGITAHPIKTLDNQVLKLQMSTGRALAELKNMAKTKFSSLKTSLANVKATLTDGQSGARGFVTALKSIGKISIGKVVTGVTKLRNNIKEGNTPANKLTTALKKAASVSFSKVTGGLKTLASHAGNAAASLGKG